MLIYNNFAIETSFTRFYNKVNLFAVYQYEEYYMFALKVYDTVFFYMKA